MQDGFTVVPLSRWGKKPLASAKVQVDPAVDVKTPPLERVNRMSAGEHFAIGADLMGVHPPHLTDWSMLARLKRGWQAGCGREQVRPAFRQAGGPARGGLLVRDDVRRGGIPGGQPAEPLCPGRPGAPKREALDGRWVPPPVKRVEATKAP